MTAQVLAMYVAALLVATMSVANADFCWKNSYGRGVGKIPDCGGGNIEWDAGLCYPKCSSGYRGVGPLCWPDCPAGFSDHGVGCTKPAAYGRGAGYVSTALCESSHGKGNCEKWGLLLYPKCKAGFWAFACCVCTPNCPKGFTDSGATCIKTSIGRGVGKIPNACPSGQENDAGLCYKKCEKLSYGVGPVCWGTCPKGFVDCGAGCASTSKECADTIKDQVLSVFDVVANTVEAVASAGTSTVAKLGVKAAAKAAFKQFTKNLSKEAFKASAKKLVKEAGEKLKDIAVDAITNAALGEEFSWEDLDPTGIVSVVNAYKHPVCK